MNLPAIVVYSLIGVTNGGDAVHRPGFGSLPSCLEARSDAMHGRSAATEAKANDDFEKARRSYEEAYRSDHPDHRPETWVEKRLAVLAERGFSQAQGDLGPDGSYRSYRILPNGMVRDEPDFYHFLSEHGQHGGPVLADAYRHMMRQDPRASERYGLKAAQCVIEVPGGDGR